MSPAPRRHDLVSVAPADWRAALDRHGSLLEGLPPEAEALVRGWAQRGWPAVARRRGEGDPPGGLPLGVPLPPDLGKLRLAVSLPARTAWRHHAGLGLAAVSRVTPPSWRGVVEALAALGSRLGIVPRPFGSALWEALTGLAYIGPASDIDVLWPVAADTDLSALLDGLHGIEGATGMEIDGEVLLPDGVGVQWRELDRARRGQGGEVLAKAIDGLSLRRVDALFRSPPGPR